MTNDSLAIELWLKDGASDAVRHSPLTHVFLGLFVLTHFSLQDMPEYMKFSLDSAATAYADMAIPLRKYAQILTEKDIPKP